MKTETRFDVIAANCKLAGVTSDNHSVVHRIGELAAFENAERAVLRSANETKTVDSNLWGLFHSETQRTARAEALVFFALWFCFLGSLASILALLAG